MTRSVVLAVTAIGNDNIVLNKTSGNVAALLQQSLMMQEIQDEKQANSLVRLAKNI